MTTEITRIPVATSAVALTVTTLTPEALDAYLLEMSPEEVAEFALRASAIAKIAGKAKAAAHARLVEMGKTGAVFYDPADNTPYQFTGGRSRRIKDIQGFVEQLAADGIDARPLVPWLSSNAFKVSESIEGDPRVAEAVKEFAQWQDEPLSLVELDKTTMKRKVTR